MTGIKAPTLKALKTRGAELDIPGRSRMNLAALIEAVAAHDTYDPGRNSSGCYTVAVEAMRDKGIKAGAIKPRFSNREEMIAAGLAQDVRVIGDCVLILGDARKVVPLLDPIDMIFTDPPYGHNNNNGDLIHRWESALGLLPSDERASLGSKPDSRAARPIANDGAAETHQLITWFFGSLPSLLRPGACCCCCCCGGGPDPQFARWSLLMDEAIDFKQMVVWDKGPMGMGWHYRRSYETVLVGQRPGAACKWYDTTDRVENIIRPGHLGIRKILPQADDHPTPKPVELPRHFIRLHTAPGETVLDPFMGGGSTAVAAVKEGRRFIGCEVDPQWFDLITKRVSSAYAQPDMFVSAPAPKPQQLGMFSEAAE